jgi:hypothetical protein
VEIRPRSTGEILDDAWRLALADAPLLLMFSTLFLVPAFIVLLLLLAQPTPGGIGQALLPALAAVLLPLTGLASGASQELFRRRAADEPASASRCLAASLRHGLEHAAARAALLCGCLPGLLILVSGVPSSASPVLRLLGFVFGPVLMLLLTLPLWTGTTSLHALIARDAARSGTLWRELRRDAAFAPGKAAAVTLCRLPLLLLVALELHLLGAAVLWIADNLGGFDTALLGVELSFLANPVYTTALFLLSWLLLTPFFEAGNFLLHTDIRTRQEGLDLQYRVQRSFTVALRSAGESAPAAVGRGRRVGALLLLACLLLLGRPAWADAGRLEVVRSVRQEVETIRDEVKKAVPYPGGQRWAARLKSLESRLVRAANGEARRFRWFSQSIADFGDRKQDDAVLVLDDLHRRLSLLEDSLKPPPDSPQTGAHSERSPEDIKSLLRGTEGRKRERTGPREKIEEEQREPERQEQRREEGEADGAGVKGGGGPRVSVPAGGGAGFSFLGWLLLGGLALAVVVVALLLYWTAPRRPRTAKPPAATGIEPADSEARQVLEESPDSLWRQAEALAGEQRFREAVRVLYLAVLSLLHRRQLIRFEPTRTNGEYVRQVRLSEQAPPELHGPFLELTGLFEAKWYGERTCEAADYRACRTRAEEIQQLVRGP